jgi:hypothetical protein
MDMKDNIISFPETIGRPRLQEDEGAPPKVYWRSRKHVGADIDQHIAARDAYGKAVAWEAAAESQNLPPAQIEEAREQTVKAFQKMQYRARSLLIVMPTDRRALVDLLLYLEQNFTILPQEMTKHSVTFEILRTVRLSLRRMEDDGQST